MAGRYKTLKAVVLLLTLSVRLSTSQFQRAADVAQIFCPGNVENFSCPPSIAGAGQVCLAFTDLCNAQATDPPFPFVTRDCEDGSDEGSDSALTTLNCELI